MFRLRAGIFDWSKLSSVNHFGVVVDPQGRFNPKQEEQILSIVSPDVRSNRDSRNSIQCISSKDADTYRKLSLV